MTYDNIINLLFIQFPFLKQKYLEEGDYIKGLPHLCYEIVFVPYIREVLINNDVENILKLCLFFESMSICEDEKVREVLVVSVLESIISERSVTKTLKKYLGLNTTQLLLSLEKAYGWKD